MDSFNIVVRSQGEQIDLNIHPESADQFKVVFHGGLVGVLRFSGEVWSAVSADMLDDAGHPVYEFDEDSGHADLLLDDQVVQQIGAQIDHVIGRNLV